MSASATAASPPSACPPTPPPTQTIDAKGLHVLPGLIDPHVHLRDPGDKAVETIPTGTRAAVLGGLAAVFDMPNTAPSIVDAEKLAWKQDYVEQVAWCDMGLYVGGTKTNIPELASLELGKRRLRHQDLRRQLDRRPDGGGRRAPGARHARRPPPHRLPQRGRIPPAGPQAPVQVGRSLCLPHGMARRGMRLPRHAPADGAGARDRAAGAHPARLHRGGARLPQGLPRHRDLRGAGEPPDPGGARLLRPAAASA